MHKFLSNLYEIEIKKQLKEVGTVTAWSAVAYCPPTSSIGNSLPSPPANNSSRHFVRTTPTMNVAMPDFSCEYWTGYIPAGQVPIFEVEFKDWTLYCALTMYDSHGLPLSSLNSKQVERYFANEEQIKLKGGEGRSTDSRISSAPASVQGGNKVFVNIMKGVKSKAYSGPICACFRVYRPNHVHITPDDDKPEVYLINRAEADTFDPRSGMMSKIPIATTSDAMDRGVEVAEKFTKLISKHLKPLKPHQLGTQFFHPSSVAGLFVNANATYVLCFVPNDKRGLVMKGRTPKQEAWRPYYGIMAIDYHTTNTLSTLTFEHLGYWDKEFELFAFRTQKEAVEAGYDSTNPLHQILLWGSECEGPLGLVLRYLHYFEIDGDTDQGREEAEKALEEQKNLCDRDGDRVETFDVQVPGCSKVLYV